MQSIQDRRVRFRQLHENATAFVMPNPFDIGSARILEGLRFDALATTSSGYAYTHGFRDAEGLISREMALSHAADIVANTTLPINGDLENGFGDTPEDVAETVRGAIEAGLAGCSIEDFCLDPVNPHYDIDLAVERIKAAVDVKQRLAPDFVLTARAEARADSPEALKKIIERLNAFAQAGADCLYAPEISSADAIRQVIASIDKPLNILAGRKKFFLTRKELESFGVTRISIGGGLSRIAYGAFTAAAEKIKDGGTFGHFDETDELKDFDLFMRGRA
ncbi:isocitrate lyase/PEP mutase family protein [Roseibium limicola]|uniref:Isocitrate lyase/phosphoenolpyruvate mutase family protein n=1 Tax=Roseibium limicola TaxID=2816037 RepID=A0A939ESE5_9HYPH|nr:isocitrate lyase/phosphoenolpyruvate mutase family protein [Roseibium limicola]MBO0347252.1 isocitrate lyase/phosphoenolpyruvate mutase family protein [Roseibium limicola]